MKKYLLIVFIVTVVLLIKTSCIGDNMGMGGIPEERYFGIDVYVRNTSTSSGVNLHLPPWWPYEYSGLDITLDPAPQPGVPVDSSGRVFGPHLFNWSLKTTIDSMVVATGEIYISWPVYALIEENNGDWTCTWSISGWE